MRPRVWVEKKKVERETILLVENEYALRELMRRFLEGSGYAVLNARDGDEALSVATAHPTPSDSRWLVPRGSHATPPR